MSHSASSPHSRRLRASYRSRLAGHAARMRVEPTPSETLLWSRLKGSQLGVAFRRQVVLGEADGKLFVVDFLAPKARLVVEVDGGAHTGRTERDERCGKALARLGYRVLRLSAELVERQVAEAAARVHEALGSWADTPPRLRFPADIPGPAFARCYDSSSSPLDQTSANLSPL